MAYLAGDIGGTKTHLSIAEEKEGKLVTIKSKKFPSQAYPNLRTIIKEFLQGENHEISQACFGIAGPVKKGKSQTTNLPWLVDTEVLKKELHISRVNLINDLEANAYGLNMLESDEFYVLNEGEKESKGNQCLISAGTGLGEAGIFYDGQKHTPFASEGGHGDFAPKNLLEDELLRYLRKQFGRVSYERILSGPGLYNLYQFVIDTNKETEDPKIFKQIVEGDSPRIITEMGESEKSKACAKTLEIFVSIYGSEAGNTALKMLSLGGVFLGGGIVPKILTSIKKGEFMLSFTSKGRFSDLLKNIPIRVVLNDNTALLGSTYYAKYVM